MQGSLGGSGAIRRNCYSTDTVAKINFLIDRHLAL
jgi:hypothetical protein